MPVIAYTKKRFSSSSLSLIEKSNEIIEEYLGMGYDLTLRQLFYQLVSRDVIPNTQKDYKRLGSVVNDGRLAGLIDWDRITDLTRELRSVGHWESPSKIISAVAKQYRIDKWKDQEYRPEVWVEKDALRNVIEAACTPLDVPYFSCRGYTSQSEMWSAAMRFQEHIENGQTPVILHFGDHDPSGIDMTRDIRDRLEIFGINLEVSRLALNMEQVKKYKPPPNPAKITDSRAEGYIAKFGQKSWELDALKPEVLAKLISDQIKSLRDEETWQESVEEEEGDRLLLDRVSDNWDDVSVYVSNLY